MRGGCRSCRPPEHIGPQDVPADAGFTLDTREQPHRNLRAAILPTPDGRPVNRELFSKLANRQALLGAVRSDGVGICHSGMVAEIATHRKGVR